MAASDCMPVHIDSQAELVEGYTPNVTLTPLCIQFVSSAFCRTSGDAEAIFRRAEATAKGLGQISAAITANGGNAAASMRIAEQVQAWQHDALQHNCPRLCACQCAISGAFSRLMRDSVAV